MDACCKLVSSASKKVSKHIPLTSLQDLEILKGYVPGFDGVIGHEFVGTVKECKSKPELEGKRVVGEINCPQDTDYR